MFEILPHPIRGNPDDAKSERVLFFDCEIRAADGASDEKPIIEIVSTSTNEDRHGSRIFEWLDDTYMQTGHVLWQHDMVKGMPSVGKKWSRRQDGDKSISTIELLIQTWERSEMHLAYGNIPRFLWESNRDFRMGNMSRGFIPIKMKRREAETIPIQLAENIDYLIVEQTEESFVNVASNRDAFARGVERMRIAGQFNETLARMIGYDPRKNSITPIIGGTRQMATQTKTLAPGATVRFIDNDQNRKNPNMIQWGYDVDATVIAVESDGKVAGVYFPANGERAATTILTDASLVSVTADAPSGWNVNEFFGSVGERKQASPERMPLARLRLIVSSTRDSLRCCYPEYDSCMPNYCEICYASIGPNGKTCNCDEELDAATAAIELDSINAMIDVLTQELTVSLSGWQAAKHTYLRSQFSYRVMDCMWQVDRLLRLRDYWYPTDTGDTMMMAADQMRAFVAAVNSDEALKNSLIEHRDSVYQTRVGKELSSKNQTRIRSMHSAATQIVDACDAMLGTNDSSTEDVTTARFIQLTDSGPVDSSRVVAGDHLIRVSAS